MAADDSYITLYGKLEDKFGDNGVVSVVIAQRKKAAHIRLWLMSCRVLKQDMELAMLDELVERCQEAGIEKFTDTIIRRRKTTWYGNSTESWALESVRRMRLETVSGS